MIPSSKYDLEAVDALQKASDEEALKDADTLLEWLQDCNWPVFEGITGKLSLYGFELYEPIENILLGTDAIWKANIVGHLIPKFSCESQLIYNELLKNLLNNPSSSDFEEGLVDFIEEQLSRNA
jgi:hypothetical protein